jgi:hypothetical protein
VQVEAHQVRKPAAILTEEDEDRALRAFAAGLKKSKKAGVRDLHKAAKA